jgi:hypothetical protein
MMDRIRVDRSGKPIGEHIGLSNQRRGGFMSKSHLIEFSDGSAKTTGAGHDAISFSCSGNEILRRFEVGGLPYIYGNGAGLVWLGELLVRIGLGEYKDGFHLHIREDCDEDKNEIFIVGIDNSIRSTTDQSNEGGPS